MRNAFRISWAGLFAGPSAWAISTQTDYALAGAQCTLDTYPIPWISFLLSLVALAGAGLSYSAWVTAAAGPQALSRKPRTENFLALVGIGMGSLFAFGILLQAYAGVVFTGCER
jgi:hypothetical protein